MMQLPATYAEAEMRAFARDWLAAAFAPGAPFHPDTDVVPLMKAFADRHPVGTDEIAYLAENGSTEADEALHELIIERGERNEPLGSVLNAYNIKLIRQRNSPKKSGPARAGNLKRDLGITMLIMALMDRFGMAVTDNPGSKRPSASTVAAAVLSDAHIGVIPDFKGVEAVWRRYMPVLARTRFTARTRRFAGGWPSDYTELFPVRMS